MKIHHIGYLVKNIDKAISKFEGLGYVSGEVTRNENRGIDVCFLEGDGYSVELVSPYTDESDVADRIKKNPNSPYHICYISENLTDDIERLKAEKYMQVSEIGKAPSIGNAEAVFMYNRDIGLIELVQFIS